MAYFFSPAQPAVLNDNLNDPHLEVTVTPSSSTFYAGEIFSVTITFRNTRNTSNDAQVPKTPLSVPLTAEVATATSQTRQLPPNDLRHPAAPRQLPQRLGQIGANLPPIRPDNGEESRSVAGPSSKPPLSIVSSSQIPNERAGHPYSPGANTEFRAPGWPGPESPQRDGLMSFRSPDGWGGKPDGYSDKDQGHTRRARSLALGRGTMSPQELVWALGGQKTPPPLPARRQPGGTQIPVHHPHSRKISLANFPSFTSGDPEDLASLPSRPLPEGRTHSLSSSPSGPASSATSSPNATSLDHNDDFVKPLPRTTPSPTRKRPVHSRAPSYHNAYGASLIGINNNTLPPPLHPYQRERMSTEPRSTSTVLWAYTRLVGHFHPSTTYIPPDPLLPLRSMLLHQPVGSGSLLTADEASMSTAGVKSSSRWQLSFGTGTIGNTTQPSLTGSLFGLAKDLVLGGAGGSLEEERKRVWNMKDLPVLETTRSLIGVDIKLKEGESRDFIYTFQLPTALPPAHRGKAFRFSYDLVISLSATLPGGGNRQKSKDIILPIRIWANVSLRHPFRTYDVLQPIIQNKEEGKVEDRGNLTSSSTAGTGDASYVMKCQSNPSESMTNQADTRESLQAYAVHLQDSLDNGINSHQRIRAASPSSHRLQSEASNSAIIDNKWAVLDIPHSDVDGRRLRPRKGSLGGSEESIMKEVGEESGCGEAVEILSRHSPKSSYDISKDGTPVAIFTLTKTNYRLGETILGVVILSQPYSVLPVLKVSASLVSYELLPEPLLPPPAHSGVIKQPHLEKLHAEYHTIYSMTAERLAISLDIPSDATPAFSLAAGEGERGGLEWKIKLSFTVGVPSPNGHRGRVVHQQNGSTTGRKAEAVHLLPVMDSQGPDGDNIFYSASTTINPWMPSVSPEDKNEDGNTRAGEKSIDRNWHEMRSELVECEVPVKVLAGNTAFLVRPSVFIV